MITHWCNKSACVAVPCRFIRRVLDEAGGHHVKIISKIESWHGVINYDDILAVTGALSGNWQALAKTGQVLGVGVFLYSCCGA